MKIVKWFIAALALGLGFNASQLVHAADDSGSGFSITADAPSTEAKGYVKYDVNAKDEKSFTVTVHNLSSKSEKYTLSVVDATTSSDGSIVYAPGNKTANTFQAKLGDMVTPTKHTLTVPAKATKNVAYRIKVPAKGFKGDVLGAVYVKRQSVSGSNGSGMGVNNAFAMSIPVHLQSGDVKSIIPTLELQSSSLTTLSRKAVIETSLVNQSARMFGQITMNSTVTNAAGKTVAKSELKDAEMAPAGIMTYQIPLTQKSLEPGTYTVRLKLTSGKRTFNLKDTFKVSREHIVKAATNAPLEQPDNTK